MYKWCVRNRKLSIFIISFPISFLLLFYNTLMRQPLKWWFYSFLFIIYIILFSFVFVHLCAQTLINRTINKLNNECNPYPMLEETTEQLGYSKLKKYNYLLIMNRCVALNDLGSYKEALSEMEGLNPNEFPEKKPWLKFIFFNNLSAYYINIEQLDHARMMQKNALEFLNYIKNDKIRKKLEICIQINTAMFYYYEKDYKKAEQIFLILDQHIDCKRNQIACYFGLAKIYLMTDRLSEAKEKLLFIVENGNRLITVEQARDLLSQYNLV